MGPEDLIRTCLGEMRESEGIAVGEVVEAYRFPLLGTEGVAAVLGGYAIGAHGVDQERSLELFEALLGAALQDREGGGRLFTRLEPRREAWAVRMLRSAHVLKGAGNVDWKTFVGTAEAVLDGRALETIPIMEYVWERTNRVLANEELLRGRE